jgi:Fic-DOC domain mobile mystery protein B
LKIDHPPGATPLDPNELDGLIPDYITTHGELNALEGANIIEAVEWAHRKKRSDFLNVTFVFDLHKRMLGQVWRWAGKPRTSDKNIGVPKEAIGQSLGVLLSDAQFWIVNQTFSWDEIAVRFHHRLVAIHPFVNGNGRHARLMTDILLASADQEPFTWGMKNVDDQIDSEGSLRDEYIAALRSADQHDYARLLQFVRS